jgi:hypothetical protein
MRSSRSSGFTTDIRPFSHRAQRDLNGTLVML